MRSLSFEIRRPVESEWSRILEILETANFHRIGGGEMAQFPLSDCFVCARGDYVVGVAGYKLLDQDTAKTTLMAVDPAYRGHGLGVRLHQARTDFLRETGARLLFLNCDDPVVVDWYARHFGFRPTGKIIEKIEDFGRSDKDVWINLVVDL